MKEEEKPTEQSLIRKRVESIMDFPCHEGLERRAEEFKCELFKAFSFFAFFPLKVTKMTSAYPLYPFPHEVQSNRSHEMGLNHEKRAIGPTLHGTFYLPFFAGILMIFAAINPD